MKKTKFLILAMIVFAMSNTAANAENFAKQSQISQAEAKKFFITLQYIWI